MNASDITQSLAAIRAITSAEAWALIDRFFIDLKADSDATLSDLTGQLNASPLKAEAARFTEAKALFVAGDVEALNALLAAESKSDREKERDAKRAEIARLEAEVLAKKAELEAIPAAATAAMEVDKK